MVQRTLWYEAKDSRIKLRQSELDDRVEPLVILGEAGMGKTHLLNWLATLPNYSRCTARQLITRANPRSLLKDADVLVIDALDEVSAQKNGDAVDLVLNQLSKLDFPRFILSCRVADWRSATGVEAIREQYDGKPLELHLEPFSDEDAVEFLSTKLGPVEAQKVIAHFKGRGLGELLGNPQTLTLIADVAERGNLPATRSQLYERAVEVLHIEHRDEKADQQLTQEAGLGATGASFAALILTGNEAIARKARANLAEGELALVEIVDLPNGRDVPQVLGTRLFRSEGADRFTYLHRRVGEFLGARWLASTAKTKRSRRRLLSIFHRYGLVPSSLRGIHAWLARDPALAEAVIGADPMGVIEYGDADDLTTEQARWLIKSLEKLATAQPYFRGWGPYSVRGIARPELVADVRRLMVDPNTPFGLRLLALEAIKGSPVAQTLKGDLRKLVLDKDETYASRNAAGQALAGLMNGNEWPPIMVALRACSDEQSTRLAMELMEDIGYEPFDDELIVGLAILYVRLNGRTVGTLFNLKSHLPDSRVAGVLNSLANDFPSVEELPERAGANELIDLTYSLIVRRLEGASVTAMELWSWLRLLDGSLGYSRDTRERLAALLQSDDVLRRQLLRLVLIEAPGERNLWQRYWSLSRSIPGLVLTSGDVVDLLDVFAQTEVGSERWREAVQLVRHNEEEGVDVRLAASHQAGNNLDLQAWIEKLATPPVPEWQIEEDERKRKYREERSQVHAQHRTFYAAKIAEARSGKFGALIDPAKAYLKLFSVVGSELPAQARIAEWLGEEVWLAACEGFEAFLAATPPKPTATEIIESYLEGRHWEAGYILVVALAERFRTNRGFDDLPDERLVAGMYELRVSPIAAHAGIEGVVPAIEAAVRARGIWADAVRQLIEPQLVAKSDRVDGLWQLMHEESDADLSIELASEWLCRFAELTAAVELELAKRLLRAGHTSELRLAAELRSELVDPERRQCWTAIGLIVDFPTTAQRVSSEPIDRDLLWHLRRLTGGRGDEEQGARLRAPQMEWIVATFRPLWPRTGYPDQGSVGDENAWDATEYLVRLINKLGGDISDEATDALGRLRTAAGDRYTEHLQSVIAENAQLRVEAAYNPPTINAIAAIANDYPPASVADLQAMMLEEMSVVQAKIASDDVESWRGFFGDSGVPYEEERCRDHLLILLRQGAEGVVLDPEAHVAGDKEVDITCAVGALRMPIEVKGQWHPDLWHAADTQLDRLYSSDWRADKRGIYLVLWFGGETPPNKELTSPGRGVPRPQSPVELCAALIARSRAAKEGRVQVVVLDVARSVPLRKTT
jgi:hypothetical protein